jgi:hypothetical protein
VIPFSKTESGAYAAGFTDVESEIIADLAAQIAGMLGGLVGSSAGSDDPLFAAVGIGGSSRLHEDPAIARLLPDAYGDDAEASGDFRRLTEQSLANRKVANARTVIDSLSAGSEEIELDEQQAQAWLRTLSDIRLTIAARLGIERDGDEGANDSDAALALHDLYDWLAYVTESLLDALDD